MRVARLSPMLLAVAALALPAPASAAGFQQIFNDYKSNGRLDGCYKPHELHNASRQIPPDIEQYAPGFGNALAGAQRGCGGSQTAETESEGEAAAPVSAGTPGRGTPASVTKKTVKQPPAPKRAAAPVIDFPRPQLDSAATSVSGGTPGGLIVLLVATGLALLLAAAWGIAWFMGWNAERLTKPLTAAFGTAWDRVSPGR